MSDQEEKSKKVPCLLRAAMRKPVEHVPVWMMRQAGRCMPGYRKVRNSVSFLELCKTPELAAEVTLEPVNILGVDAAIIFSDILIPVEAMGMKLVFSNSRGPEFTAPVRSKKDVERLVIPEPQERCDFVMELIKMVCGDVDEDTAVIGFAGAPFTLMSFMVEGKTSYTLSMTHRFLQNDPVLAHRLLEKLTMTTIKYIKAQIDSGVHIVQLFDTRAGMFSPEDVREFALPYADAVAEKFSDGSACPVIYYIKGIAPYITDIRELPVDVISLDWMVDIERAARALENKFALQGNADPYLLLGPLRLIENRVHSLMEQMKDYNGYICNLGHGILPDTPVENARAFVDYVHRYGKHSREKK